MKRIEYQPSLSLVWDTIVSGSRNGTFLLKRPFLDYHADRFTDCSLLYYKDDNKPLGAFPATLHSDGTVVSHGGLTYGGWLLLPEAHAIDVGQMVDMTLDYYRAKGCKQLIVKPIPHIYHRQPCDEELYWLFRHGAHLVACGLSSAIDLRTPLPFSTLRRRKAKKAQNEGLTIKPTAEKSDYQQYWLLLTEVLQQQHQRVPVHTIEEILLLQNRFPENIRLYVATAPDEDNIIAGTLLFYTDKVVHAQYIAASEKGRNCGALDLLFEHLITESAAQGYIYFDFGISTEEGGTYLNEGLNFQKEGFGARSIVYDTYSIDLSNGNTSS